MFKQNFVLNMSSLKKIFYSKEIRNNILLNLSLVFSSAIIIGYFIGTCSESAQYEKLVLIFGPIVFLLFFAEKLNTIIILFILVNYINYFIYLFALPRVLTWYIEIASLAIFVICISYYLRTRNTKKLRPFLDILITIVLFHICSCILNKQSLMRFFVSSRIYYMYIIFFLAIIYLPASIITYKRLITIMIFTMFIQIPISILQDFIFIRADFKGGLFGPNSAGTISSLGVAFGFCGYYLYRYYRKNNIYLVSSIGMIIPLILSEAKFGILFLSFAYIYNFFIEKEQIMRKLIFLIIIIPGYYYLLQGFDYINSRRLEYHPYMHKTLENPLYIITRESKFIRDNVYIESSVDEFARPLMGRLASVAYSLNIIKEGALPCWLGYGPGEALKDPYLPGSLLHLGFFPNLLSILLLEWGVIGTFLWLVLFGYLMIVNIKTMLFFRKINGNSLWKAFCYFSNMQMLIFIFEFVYSRSFLLEYKALYFWISNGLIVWYYKNHIENRRLTGDSKS